MSGVAVAEPAARVASVTLPGGQVVTANMTPLERSAVIRQSMGLPVIEQEHTPGQQFHTPHTAARLAQGDRERGSTPAQPQESGTAGEAPHAGMVAPTPEQLEASNTKLAQFEEEMRGKGIGMVEPNSNLQRDERTGIMVDVAALERCHELYRSLDPKEREAAREDYSATLREIYAGKLGLADMEDSPSGAPARDAQGRFAPSEQPAYTVKQMQEEHAKVADSDGWIPLARVGKWALSGYTLKQFIPDQRLNPAAFGMLANARKAGVTQAQVDAFLENQMREDGWIK